MMAYNSDYCGVQEEKFTASEAMMSPVSLGARSIDFEASKNHTTTPNCVPVNENRHIVTPSNSHEESTTSMSPMGTEPVLEESGGTRDAALLLTSVVAIATKEVCVDKTPSNKLKVPILDHTTPSSASKDEPMKDGACQYTMSLSPRFSHLCSIFESEYQHEKEMERQSINRARTVSMDSNLSLSSIDCENEAVTQDHAYSMMGTPDTGSNLISPPTSPVLTSRRAARKPRCADRRKRFVDKTVSSSSSISDGSSDEGKHHTGLNGRPLQPPEVLRRQQVKTILKRKFSWKNYPELEAFLIANREEYLRHSALNYTVQQKQYNNRLTEQLLELAAEHGYVFDEDAFSFVTVRDRIRCYFKSYVQSSKKRGVIIGYAARRAGLLSNDELEKSAGIAGRIVLPSI